mgnify:CR=1 FL=1
MGLNERVCLSGGKSKTRDIVRESFVAIGRTLRDTEISKPLTGRRLKKSISCAGDSHANRSVSPGSDEARQMTVTSGRRLSAVSTHSGPLGFLVRMCLESSTWHSTRCVLTWKASVTPSGRSVYRLVPSMRGIKDSESGLWPTARARMTGGLSPERVNDRFNNLESVLSRQMWPTLAVGVTGGPTGLGGGSGNRNKVYRMLGETEGKKLCCGSLSPEWVEWFMGYPIKHTELEDSGTRLSRRLPKR